MHEARPLTGRRILVTRPAQRAAAFAQRISAAGGNAVVFPVIEICAPLYTGSRDTALNNLADYDMAIFISPTAVEETLARVPALPASLQLVAIGNSTARALKHRGYALAFEANNYNSESLLAQAQMQAAHVSQQRIVIFRGEGGRELLADTLRQRGAQVDYADMYRRALPAVAQLERAQIQALDALCVTSNQGLEHLLQLCEEPAALKKIALIVPGQRCASHAQDLGFSEIHTADDATDDAMLRMLMQWAGTTHSPSG